MNDEVISLAGAYVLDALDDDERARFEAYLAESPEAAAEVRELREAAALLGAAAAEPPPDGLQAAVMRRIGTVGQEPPVRPHEPPAAVRATTRIPRLRSTGMASKLAYGVAAAAVVIAVGLGAVVAQLASRIDTIQQTNDQIAAVVAAEDARRLSATVEGGGTLSAVVAPSQGAAVVVGRSLPSLPEDRVYAVWAMLGEEATPVGELVAGEPLPMTSDEMDGIGLTVEPAGPLTTPTGELAALLEV